MTVEKQRIVIVGAGRVGVAAATLLQQNTSHEVIITDVEQSALDNAVATGAMFGWSDLDFRLCQNQELLEAELRKLKPYAVLCCTPQHVNVGIAKICAKIKAHYIDFSSNPDVVTGIVNLNPSRITCVLQTGLTPGLSTCISKMLLERLRRRGITPTSLQIRAGALPEVAQLPSAYALTWSTKGLIAEYTNPVQRIEGGEVVMDEPLDAHEELIIDGTPMEAFNTSGGLGDPSMYQGLQTADFKTLRYPGHLDYLQKKVLLPAQRAEDPFTAAVNLAEQVFPTTRDDVVFMAIRASGVDSTGHTHETTFQHKFYGLNGLTAIELTTAGTGAAIVELLDKLPHGILFGGNIRLSDLFHTKIGHLFLASCITEV
jgi:saccharopine dehydrogenase-like NADP-dependent oxidoreductase